MGFERLTARSTIVLPIGDRDWVIESPDAATGAFVNDLWERTGRARREGRELTEADLVLDEDQQRDMYARVLGAETYAAMTDPGSGCAWADVQLAATTTMAWIAVSLEAAEVFFNSGGLVDPPEAPNRAARRAKVIKGQVVRDNAAVTASRARRVSTAGTTTPTPRAAAAAVGSRGRSSATTGR